MVLDWDAIERAWREAVLDAIRATAASNPTERIYAGAFWLLHGDYTSLLVPAFGLNAESSDPQFRWHPPDWRWSVIDEAIHRVAPLYEPLQALEVDGQTFESLCEQHINVLARVSRQVTALVRSGHVAPGAAAFSPSFFVGIIDFAQGEAAVDYLKRSVDEETIEAAGILSEE